MADNTTANAGTGGDTFAAKDIVGVKYPRNIITDSAGVDIVPLTDTALRASAVPVSLASVPSHAVTLTSTTITGSVAVTGAFYQATQPISAASLPLPAGAATETTAAAINTTLTAGTVQLAAGGVVGATPSTRAVQVSGSDYGGTPLSRAIKVDSAGAQYIGNFPATQAVTGTFWQATQPVSLTSTTITGTVAVTQSGAWSLTANQSVNMSQINAVAPLMGNGTTGTGSQRVTIASDNTAFSVNATPPTLTKGTQGANGNSVQQLRDAGRAIVNAATAIAGVTAVTTEALLTLNVSRDGAATAAVTTIAVTSGKRLRIIGITSGVISTGASVIAARVSLRLNPSGVAAATSPILCTISLSQQAAALAQAGDTQSIMFPEAIEISGTMQVGLSQVASAITGTVWASLIAYEY